MSAARLLSQLRSLGAEVGVSAGRLRVSVARGQLSDELKSAIAAQKGELIALLAEQQPADEVPVLPLNVARPLSFFQERLWFLHRLQPENTAYNLVAHWLSPGPVDVADLVKAIEAIGERHAILRTRFRETEGEPEAHWPPGAVPVEVLDLREQSPEQQAARIESERERRVHTPFALRSEGPARFIVYRLGGDRVVTGLLAHHIVVDAWSMALIGREITGFYAGAEAPPSPARSYADFAVWQRKSLDEGGLAAQLDFWQRYLANWPALSTLPSNRPRSRLARGGTREFRFDRALSDGLRNLVREERVTLYMALTSAMATVLNWYSRQTRMLLGSPMGLRERPEFESIVGPFVNVLLLKLDLGDDPSFAELLSRARTAVLDAHANRDVPFERLVQQLKPKPIPDHAPLFQVAVVLHNGPATVRIDSGGALFDLSWFVRELDGELVGGLEYRQDAYDATVIDELLARLEAVLRAAVANRHERLTQLSRLFAGEPRPSSAGVGADQAMPAGSAVEPIASLKKTFDALPALALGERSHQPAPSRHTRFSLAWSGARIEALAASASTEQVSVAVFLLAAFACFAQRYTGRTEFSMPVLSDAPDSAPSGEPRVLVVEVRVNPQATFRELLRAISEKLTVASGVAKPLESFCVELARDSLSLPVLCDLRSARPGASSAPFEPGPVEKLATGCAFLVRLGEESSAAWIEYDDASFEPLAIERLASYFGAVVDAVAREPGIFMPRVSLLSEHGRAALLRTLHATFATSAPLSPVTELIAEQARRHPERLAVADAADAISYAELEQAATALALRLRQAGVQPGSRVAVGVGRSRAMIVALLAVLKARAAYLPLDPRYPLERLTYLLEDGAPAALLIDESSRGRMPLTLPIPIVEVESTRPAPPGNASDLGSVDPDSVAYVLYTSGSTGRPKGVQIPHRALTNFLLSMQRKPGLVPGDRVISLTTVSFDIAGLEIFLPLVTGASVHVAGADIVGDGVRLGAFVERSGATLLQATPPTFRMLIDAGWQGGPHLKLLCGGEALPRELADQLLTRGGSLWNMYGPTETTIWSTLHEVKRHAGPVLIGTPIDNTAVYVLDQNGELAPQGVPGELFIGGAGVAVGYLKRPELDAQRFVVDPFLGGAARMYRTGDAGRLAHDGTLEYLGRLDDQVKIRGHRIELGEIEAVMREHPGVASAVVAVREPTPGDARLVGYYVARDSAIAPRELREICQRKLPPAMVPSAWMPIDRIPLTPNGKTDRKALPAPSESMAESDVEGTAPRDALEIELLRIWESVLHTRVTSIRDSFFDLGGHSLLAMRVLSRVEKSLRVTLPLSIMLESPTIEHLAERIRELSRNTGSRAGAERHFSFIVPIRGHGARPALFCVHGAGGNVLNLYDIARLLPPEQPFYGIQAAGVDGFTRPKESIEEIASDYLAELRLIQPKGPYFLSGYCGGGIIAYEMAQRLRAAGEEVPLLLLIDAYRPGACTSDRIDGWQRALAREDLPALARRLQAKVQRDTTSFARALQLQYYLLRGMPVPHELREFWLTVTFMRTVANYELRPYEGKLTVIRARDTNPEFTAQHPDLGWASLAAAGVVSHEVPGDHHTIAREPHVKWLSALLEACLAASHAAFSSGSAAVGPARTPGGSL